MNAPTRPPLRRTGRRCRGGFPPPPVVSSLSLRPRVSLPKTRVHVRLLGPCFKTGRTTPSRQHCEERRRRPRRPPAAWASSARADGNPATDGRRRGDPRVRRRARPTKDGPEKRRAADLYDPGRRTPRSTPSAASRDSPGRRWHAARGREPAGPPRASPRGLLRPSGFPRGGIPAGWTRTPRSPAAYVFLITISSAFDPLFRVLFTFPSQYFFAIGLVAVFSFGWDQPP